MSQRSQLPTQLATSQPVVIDLSALAPLLHEINGQLQQELARHQEELAKHQTDLHVDITSILENDNVAALLKTNTLMKYRARKEARITPAAERAFRVTEVLEAVLLELPTRDLLLAQRVNAQLNKVINQSTKIRRALYVDVASAFERGKAVIPMINPLLLMRPSYSSVPVYFDMSGSALTFSANSVGALPTQNSAATVEGHESSNASTYAKDYEVQVKTYIARTGRFSRGLSGATKGYATGSWRRMHLTQPSCQIRLMIITTYSKIYKCGARTAGQCWWESSYMDAPPITIEEYEKLAKAQVDLRKAPHRVAQAAAASR